MYVIRLLDNGLSGAQGVANDKISQVGVVQRHGTQEKRLIFGANAQRQPAVVFHRYSRHGSAPFFLLYIFKVYTPIVRTSLSKPIDTPSPLRDTGIA